MGFSIPIPNPINVAKSVIHTGEDLGGDLIQTTTTVVKTTVDYTVVKPFQFEASIVRFGLEKTYDAGRAGVHLFERGFDKISHPGASNPPPAQGLKFSETKGASDIAYDATKGQTYKFADGKHWKVVDVSQDKGSGFRAIALQSTDPNDHRTIVAFAGTDPSSGKDWFADASQGLGLPSKQYNEAVQFANKWKSKSDDVILTGHSLGGGLASYASIKTGLPATAVNSAPLALDHLGFNPAVINRITQYYVPGEVLSDVNAANPLDARPGINIPVQGRTSIFDPRAIYQNHTIGNVAPDVPSATYIGDYK